MIQVITVFFEMFATLLREIFSSYLNITLLVICLILIYGMLPAKEPEFTPPPPPLPKLKKDLTHQELLQYDGKGPDGRICLAVLGNIYDVTKGKAHYGPDGPYSALAGHDASRSLATFELTNVKAELDDLSNLTADELDEAKNWEMTFKERYDFVGKLLKPGEEPSVYQDNEVED